MSLLEIFRCLATVKALLISVPLAAAQLYLIPQNDTFGSAAELTQLQKLNAAINDSLANNIEVALNFERSNWANGSVHTDPFYRVPGNASTAPFGSLLKLEVRANTSSYTLPPNTALSRILYQSRTLNGTPVPNSAYVLWPYSLAPSLMAIR